MNRHAHACVLETRRFRYIYTTKYTEKEERSVAKDGTARGGLRRGAGRKGTEDAPVTFAASRNKAPAYMTKKQANSAAFQARKIYAKTWEFLERMDVAEYINPQLVEEYAMATARWIQCEEIVSKEGLTGEHPTTGAVIASPFVTMAQNYAKEKNAVWFAIEQTIREHGGDPGDEDDPIAGLLS